MKNVHEIIYTRYRGRKILKIIAYINYIFLIILALLGILFLHSTFLTRYYILDIDDFWKKRIENPFYLKLQRRTDLIGIFLLCSSIFSIMNNTVIIVHIYKGGLKRRFKYAIIIGLFLSFVKFILAIIVFVMFKTMLILFIIYYPLSTINFIFSLISFIYQYKALKNENPFLASFKELNNILKKQKAI